VRFVSRITRRLGLEGPDEFEPHFESILRKLVVKGSTCVDVGANVGVVTELLARLVGPGGHVVAFDAHPDNAAVVRERVRRFGDRVTVEASAVSDGSLETVTLYAGRDSHPAEWNLRGRDVEGHETQPALEVPATSLDDYFGDDANLSVIKIDVEGVEGDVLAGMTRLLRDARPSLLIEFHDDEAWASRELLYDADYALYRTTWEEVPRGESRRAYHCVALPRERS
jgi:FkbM family methyltransferase